MYDSNSKSHDNERLVINQEVTAALNGNPDTTDSISLRMQKFVWQSEKPKMSEWQKICACAHRGSTNVVHPPLPGAETFTAVLRSRMMINHSGVMLNASLNLHRFFGCPIIPGSALKGISRHMAKLAMDCGELAREDWLRIWGNEPLQTGERPAADEVMHSGTVAFLAAEPADDKWQLTVDILNSHNDCDTKNPIPVFFPAVERGARFTFSVYPLKRVSAEKKDIELAVRYLKRALSENGVGAKTASGYGWFEFEAVEDDETFISKLSYIEYTGYLSAIGSWSDNRQKLYMIRLLKEKQKWVRQQINKNNETNVGLINKYLNKFNLENPIHE